MRTNPMKARLAAGEPVLGCSVMIPSPQVVEMLGLLGFDWVLIDCEHGTVSLESVELMALAAEAAGVVPIARPPSNSPGDIVRLMDRGVMGVQVPHVTDAASARAAVAAVKFAPEGERGLAAGTRPAAYGFAGTMAEECARANAETLVCVQIEDAEAVANAAEIVAVEDIDVFFIGPSDLSQSLGHPGEHDHPEVRAAIEATLERILAAGRTPGAPASTTSLPGLIERGVRYLYTHLPRLLAGPAREFLAAGRGHGGH